MDKAKFFGVQTLSVQAFDAAARAVDGIPRQRMADTGHVYADLVGAAGLELAGNVGEIAKAFQHAPAGVGIARTRNFRGYDGHFFAVARVAAEVGFHKALVLFQVAVDDGMIDAVDAVHAELRAERLVRGIVFSHDQQSAGVLINTVDDTGPDRPADTRKLPGAMIEQCVDKCAVRVAGCGMHHHALGLVDDDQVGILVDDIERDILRLKRALNYLGLRGKTPYVPDLEEPPLPQAVLSPRQARFAQAKRTRLGQALGKIAADPIAPYPPGVPVVAPGEVLTEKILDYLYKLCYDESSVILTVEEAAD